MMKIFQQEVLAQLLGMLGVTASLLFVGFEIKQSRDIATAELYLAQAELEMEAGSLLYSPEMLRPVVDKMYSGEKLSPGEQRLLIEYTETWMGMVDTTHFQYQLGLVPDEVWAARREQIRALLEVPCYSEYFGGWGGRVRASFVADIADLIAAAPKQEECEVGD